MDQWMTVKEVAAYLQLSPDQIYRWAQQGKIPVSRVGSRWRFKQEKIDQWMEEQAAGVATNAVGPADELSRRTA